MAVLRVVANLQASHPQVLAKFYAELLGLNTVMDADWIVTLAADNATPPQLSIARQGGAGLPVPALSIEVDDVDAVHASALEAGIKIVHSLKDEPWGVRRFFLRDPEGTVVNILSHAR